MKSLKEYISINEFLVKGHTTKNKNTGIFLKQRTFLFRWN